MSRTFPFARVSSQEKNYDTRALIFQKYLFESCGVFVPVGITSGILEGFVMLQWKGHKAIKVLLHSCTGNERVTLLVC